MTEYQPEAQRWDVPKSSIHAVGVLGPSTRFRMVMEKDHLAALRACEDRILSMRFTEFMKLVKERCPCICHEQTTGINPHDDKCVCNGGTGMEAL